jgi:histidinol-phosphate aminotransferase
MTKFLSKRYKDLAPYAPGPHPKDRKYIKLNQNESPYPPSPAVKKALSDSLVDSLHMYEDPFCMELREAIAKVNGLRADQIFVGNGSDEVLAFLFQAFFDEEQGVAFTDITYDFYQCCCRTYNVNYEIIPLKEDFSYDLDAFMHTKKGIVLANPNAPTGMRISLDEIEKLLQSSPDRLVVIDEAYVDFDNPTCIPLLKKYPNLIVLQTFSKSRCLAAGRIGFAAASKEIIDDMRALKFSFSPFNLSALSIAAGTAAALDTDYVKQCADQTIAVRDKFTQGLKRLGFQYLDSHANFVFAMHPCISGEELWHDLKDAGILTRWYNEPRIKEYLRISIGTEEDMCQVLKICEEILKKRGLC